MPAGPLSAAPDAESCFRGPAVTCLLPLALEGASAAARPEEQASLLVEIAVVRAQAGDAAGARDIFRAGLDASRGIRDPRVRADLLCFFATRQAESGDGAAARQTLTDAVGLIERALADDDGMASYTMTHTLRECAAVQARIGDSSGASATLRRLVDRFDAVSDPKARHTEMISTAVTQSAIGDVDGAGSTLLAARRLALSLAPGVERLDQLLVVAGEQLRMGSIGDARSTLADAVAAYPATTASNERRRLAMAIAILMLKLTPQ
jgi:hypothetical protein